MQQERCYNRCCTRPGSLKARARRGARAFERARPVRRVDVDGRQVRERFGPVDAAEAAGMATSNLVAMDDGKGPIDDQVEAIGEGARLKLAGARDRAHILGAVLRALDQWDELVATMRASETSMEARDRVAGLLGIDQTQASAVTGITMTMLTARHRRLMAEDYERQTELIAELEPVVASPERQRELVGTERGSHLARHGGE